MAFLTLDKLCQDFQIILLDASAINCFLECRGAQSEKLKERINYAIEEKNSVIFFRKYFNKENNFLITSLIFDELDYKENFSIRETLAKYDFLTISEKEKEYYRESCAYKKEINKLLKIIKKKEKILNFNQYEKKEYFCSFERNFYLKKRHNLSDPDYDMLISGAVLSKLRGKTAILSNDFPLLCSYKSLVYEEKLNTENYGFFLRPKKEFFKKG